MAHYAIALDTHRCIGCFSCTVACKLENNLPDQVWYAEVKTVGGNSMHTPAGEYGSNTLSYLVTQCNHCDNPACVAACPTGATYKDGETGIVMQNVEECIGCQSCIEACPYEGVRTYVDGDPVSALDFPVGSVEAPVHLANTVEKCTMCAHRIAQGRIPACVEGCPARARYFGDLDDPESEISQVLAAHEYTQLLPEEGTGPNVFYLS